jgi:hypothetical protein
MNGHDGDAPWLDDGPGDCPMCGTELLEDDGTCPKCFWYPLAGLIKDDEIESREKQET